MKNKYLWILSLILFPLVAQAADESYLYRSGIQWVKIVKADKKITGTLKHPYTGINAEEMEDMLLSVHINRRYLLKNELQTVDIFNSWEARQVSQYIVEGLTRIDPTQMINFTVIHKRPIFILRKDYFTMGDVWVAEDGVHIRFTKLFAAIAGDYQASAHRDDAVRKTKTYKASLEAGPGQQLAYDSPTEIILDPTHDFQADVRLAEEDRRMREEDEMRGGRRREARGIEPSRYSSDRSSRGSSGGADNIAGRLKRLDDLRKQGLISEQEYQVLRKKILQDI